MRKRVTAFRYLDLSKISRRKLRRLADAMWAELPEETEILVAYYTDRLTEAEIAAKFGISQGTVSRRLRKADEFFTRQLLDLPEPLPPNPTVAAVARTLGTTRKELAMRLAHSLTVAEIGEALGEDPILFAEKLRLLRHADPTQLREALKLIRDSEK